MSRRDDTFDPAENDDILDTAAIARDEELLAELAAAGTTWSLADAPASESDAAIGLLSALRDDVSQDLPDDDTFVLTPGVVDLSARRRLRERLGSRTAVAGVVAFAMLSASGVAAAELATDRGAVESIKQLIVDDEPTASELAAKQARQHLDAAEGFLNKGRIAKCEAELEAAEALLAQVDAADIGGLADRLAALERRYGDAGYSMDDDSGSDDNSGSGSGDDRDDDDNSGSGSGDDRDDDDNSGSGSGGSDDDDDNSGSGSGGSDDDDDNSGPGSGDDRDDDDNSGSGSGGSDDDSDNSGSGSRSDADDDSGSGSSGSDDDDDPDADDDNSGPGSGGSSGSDESVDD